MQILLCFLLGSCSQDLPHEGVAYPKVTRTGVQYLESDKDLSRLAWWMALHDPELDDLLLKALACNDKIKSAYATIESAQAQLKSAQYAWLPTFNYTASGFNGSTWNSQATPGSLITSPLPFFTRLTNIKFHGYLTGFVPKYDLNILKNLSNIKAAKATLAMQEAQAESIKLSIISQMTGTYFMLLSQRNS